MEWLGPFAGRTGWLNLNGVSQSFISKAIIVLSLTAFLLGNAPAALVWFGATGWRVRMAFVGALFFLAGHLIALLRAPPEFGGRSDPVRIVADMIDIHSPSLLQERRAMLQSLVARFLLAPPADLPAGQVVLAQQVLARRAPWPAEVYEADIQLRQFDAPAWRAAAWALLIIGGVLLLVPTLVNVVLALGTTFDL